jgi:uncharacterized protein (TIGR02001 family)
MKLNKLHLVTLTALGLGTLGAAMPAQAGTSASVAVSSGYLWRGLMISGPAPAVSGDLYYNHDSGAYAGIWTSSEGFANSQETDLNVGFSKSFGDAGIDIGVYEYLYPNAVNSDSEDALSDTDASEFYIGGKFGPVGAKLFVNTETTDNMYLTIDGSFGKFGAHIGMTMNEDDAAEYTDFNVSFSPVTNLTWTVSVASGDGAEAAGQEDPQFLVSYKWPFDVK